VAIYAYDYTLYQITSAEGWNVDSVGESACLAGYASNYRCGTIADKSHDVYYQDDNKRFYSMRRVSFASVAGDSGGPYFSVVIRRWQGIQSGNSTDWTGTVHAFYSHVDDARVSLGLSGYDFNN
jgi:hypothetical protein